MTVNKTQILITVLMRQELADRLSTMDLSRVAEEMDFGDMVGDYRILSSAELSPDAVERELREVGNDGTFFGELPGTRDNAAALSEDSARSDDVGKIDHE